MKYYLTLIFTIQSIPIFSHRPKTTQFSVIDRNLLIVVKTNPEIAASLLFRNRTTYFRPYALRASQQRQSNHLHIDLFL